MPTSQDLLYFCSRSEKNYSDCWQLTYLVFLLLPPSRRILVDDVKPPPLIWQEDFWKQVVPEFNTHKWHSGQFQNRIKFGFSLMWALGLPYCQCSSCRELLDVCCSCFFISPRASPKVRLLNLLNTWNDAQVSDKREMPIHHIVIYSNAFLPTCILIICSYWIYDDVFSIKGNSFYSL